MSEGRTSPETLQEQWRPTLEDINLLHEIVIRAQEDPLSQQSTKDALLNAYTAVFNEHGLQAEKDKVCCWTLLKIIDPNGPPGTLYEKFERVLEEEGIELSFDDDEASEDVGTKPRSTFRFSPQKHKSPHRIKQRPHSQQANIILPSQKPLQQLTATHEFDPLTETVPESFGGGSIFDDDYVDNPPSHISQLMQVAEAMDRKTLLRQSLAVLRPRGLGLTEARADLYCEDALRSKAWSQWRAIAHSHVTNCANADVHHSRHLKRRFLHKLLDAARIHRMRAMEEERLKGMALYKLALVSREAQFSRGIDTKLKAKYLGTLMRVFQSYQNHDMQLQPILRQHEAELKTRLLRPALEVLVTRARNIAAGQQVAENLHDMSLKKSTVTRWYRAVENVVQWNSAAEDARRNYLMRKYLFKFHSLAQAKRARRLVLVRWTLSRWHNYLDVKKHQKYDEAYRAIRRKVKMNLARRLLGEWTDQTRKIQHLNSQAIDMHDRKLRDIAHRSITTIYERSQQLVALQSTAQRKSDQLALKHTLGAITDRKQQVLQMNEVADRFYKLHTQQVASKCLKHLNMKSFEIRRRQRDVEAFQQRHEKKLARMTLDRMRVATLHSRGEEPLHLPPATPAQRRAQEISRLTSTTPIYTPASRLLFTARLRGEKPAELSTILGRESEEDSILIEEDKVMRQPTAAAVVEGSEISEVQGTH